MNNKNQQVPPLPNQPPINAPNNLTFFKTLAYGFVIVSVGISIAVGGYLLGAKQSLPLSQISQNEQKLADAKKRDLRIISDMTQSKTIAELINSDNGNYSRVNCNNIQLSSLCSDIKRLSEQEFAFYSSDSAYCGYAKLSSGSYGSYYCVDSIYSGKTDINPNGVNYCNGNTYVCPPVSAVVDSESSSQNQTDPTANWKTYINESYGFEIKYPNDWIVQDKLRQKPEKAASNNNLELSNSSLPESPKFILFINPLGFGLPIPDKVYELSPTKDGKLEIINRQEIAPIKEGMTNIDGHTIINSKTFEIDNNSYLFTFDFVQGGKDYEPILNQILSTFKFADINPRITGSANSALPITCEDKQEGVPVITSLSNYSGSVGTKIEIRGCNFSGFEGDKTAWIENEQAVKGILYGEEGSTSKILKVTLKSPLCQNNSSYSGLPCNAWITLNTGTYKIYTSSWNKKSNEANFTIK